MGCDEVDVAGDGNDGEGGDGVHRGREEEAARGRGRGRQSAASGQGEVGRRLNRTYPQPPTLHLTLLSYMSHSVVDVRVVDTDQCVRPCYAMLVLYFKVEYGCLGDAYTRTLDRYAMLWRCL